MKTFKDFLVESDSHIENHPISKMREYTDKEFPWEYREYTKYASHKFPGMFKSEEHFKQHYDKAPLKHLTPHEVRNLSYSTAGSYLHKADVKTKVQQAHNEFSHRRDLNRIHDELHHGKMAPPIVIHHDGGMRILGGNTRLSYGLAHNKMIPVKLIDMRTKKVDEGFSYSTGQWRHYVIDKDGKPLEPFKFYDKKHEAEKKAKEVGGKVKKTRY